MKTKELIRQLEEADPSGELDVVIGNKSVYAVNNVPGYHDGAYEVLIQDHDNKFYNICGAKITLRKRKVTIIPMSIEDTILDFPSMPIKYELGTDERSKRCKDTVVRWRKEALWIEKSIRNNVKAASHKNNIREIEQYLSTGEDRTDEELRQLVRKMRVKLGGKDEDLDF